MKTPMERFLFRSRFVLPLLLAFDHGWASNWPQFRGPQARGVDSSTAAPIQWDLEKSENVLWRTPIPGLGHSSPILWGNRIYVTT
ncbi:MAG: PQQ-binding-like beta-propeller repeat protein, partial [Verrucomicrobia bacterium]|nr:PQQ-binding-like beta-propeller repeat protein [Verrucomicrobiota bacterium]